MAMVHGSLDKELGIGFVATIHRYIYTVNDSRIQEREIISHAVIPISNRVYKLMRLS